ncbi:putative ABC transport system permease protein [Nitrosomonas eutropha]|uniref:Putative ABC transport system permease protein n=1 Tax=Nitrosomonas eutropha TaxID=916 RepID=A0A1I7FG86_9PROT|nr:FtsX-like permease family protein [Nitrosomonas eutropha]SFU35144.1 putative ABC transport system permease protein [Nitrosomonas eutropha]
MNMIRLSLRMLLRDWRAGELYILTLALVIAVSSVATVSFFSDRVQKALVLESNQLLGGDLLITSDNPVPPSYAEHANQIGLRTTHLAKFPSMVSFGDNSLLTSIKAVAPGYPLRGELKLTNPPTEENVAQSVRIAQGIPKPGTVWVGEKVIDALKVTLGDKVEVGAAELTVVSIVESEPDHSVGFVSMNPRLLMNEKDLAATRLIQPGSRISYQLLVAGEEPQVKEFRYWIKDRLSPGERVVSIQEARPEIRSALDRAGKFLNLAALASVVVAAAAIALAIRRFIQRHLDGCAVMRCLGATESDLLRLYSYYFIVLGLVASLSGCVLAVLTQEFLSYWLEELIGVTLPLPSSLPAIQGMLTGMVLLLGFALPPLLNLRQVPALRVIRRDLELVNMHSLAGYGFGVGILSILFIWKAGSFKLGIMIMLGFLLAVIFFGLFGWLLIRLFLLTRSPGSGPWSYGLANIRRRAIPSLVQATALGLGLMALLTLTLTRNDLLQDWQARLPENAPNRFLVNVQPDQQEKLMVFFDGYAIPRPKVFPMVRGRLLKINDRAVSLEDYPDPRAKQLINREFNLSWTDTLQADNEIVAGHWWREEAVSSEHELSMEEGFAETLGLKLGDRLSFYTGGGSFSATITSLRTVDWDTFHVNFFAVVRPGLLDNYPASYITSFYLPPDKIHIMQELTRIFPNFLVIDVASVIERVQSMIGQVTHAIEFVFLFTLLAGFAVMYAAIASTQDERIYEAAIFRTLGAKKQQLARAWAVEFAVLGALAGSFAAAGASVLGYLIGKYALHITYSPSPWIGVIGILVSVIGVTAFGLIGTRVTLSQPPLQVLRK